MYCHSDYYAATTFSMAFHAFAIRRQPMSVITITPASGR
jgi:hypothetical protein